VPIFSTQVPKIGTFDVFKKSLQARDIKKVVLDFQNWSMSVFLPKTFFENYSKKVFHFGLKGEQSLFIF